MTGNWRAVAALWMWMICAWRAVTALQMWMSRFASRNALRAAQLTRQHHVDQLGIGLAARLPHFLQHLGDQEAEQAELAVAVALDLSRMRGEHAVNDGQDLGTHPFELLQLFGGE